MWPYTVVLEGSVKRSEKARGASEVRVMMDVTVALSVAVMLDVIVSWIEVSWERGLCRLGWSHDIARGYGADDACGLGCHDRGS
jgi:hypothetical protein